jgi:Mrp family chromosome partitioning ATPase
LLESLKHSFDLIIFDLPPANELTTCYAFASCMDGIVVVVEPRQVDRDVARRSARQLKEVNAKLLGVVYNKDRTQR